MASRDAGVHMSAMTRGQCHVMVVAARRGVETLVCGPEGMLF